MLRDAGFAFEVVPPQVEEPEPPRGTDVRDYVATLAFRKALAVSLARPQGIVLAADTACAVDGEILNKPVDRADAERMIRLQEGRETEVWTGLVVFDCGRRSWVGAIECSVVVVRRLLDAERNAYLDSNQWVGKAGGYGVQDDDPFVTVVSGSFSNVVGLPIERLRGLLDSIARA